MTAKLGRRQALRGRSRTQIKAGDESDEIRANEH
jgi:hypothetical protein